MGLDNFARCSGRFWDPMWRRLHLMRSDARRFSEFSDYVSEFVRGCTGRTLVSLDSDLRAALFYPQLTKRRAKETEKIVDVLSSHRQPETSSFTNAPWDT